MGIISVKTERTPHLRKTYLWACDHCGTESEWSGNRMAHKFGGRSRVGGKHGKMYCGNECRAGAKRAETAARIKGGVAECRACGETKPVSEFVRNSTSSAGIEFTCKPCRSKQNKVWAEQRKNRGHCRGGGDRAYRNPRKDREHYVQERVHAGFFVDSLQREPIRGKYDRLPDEECWICPVCGMGFKGKGEAKWCCQTPSIPAKREGR
jgi:hypothetical protein